LVGIIRAGTAERPRATRPSEVRGVHQAIAGGIQLGHKRIVAPAKNGLEGARGRRKVRRIRSSGYVDVPGGVHGDIRAIIVSAATEVGSIDKRGVGGIQLGHEGIEGAAAVCPLEGTYRKEVRRSGRAHDIGVASGVNSNAATEILSTAAEVRGVGQDGVDDQRLAGVIGSYLNADLYVPPARSSLAA